MRTETRSSAMPFPIPNTDPAELGLDPGRLGWICDRIEADVAAGHHPGAQVAKRSTG